MVSLPGHGMPSQSVSLPARQRESKGIQVFQVPVALLLSTVPSQLTEILVHILLRSGESLLDDEG